MTEEVLAFIEEASMLKEVFLEGTNGFTDFTMCCPNAEEADECKNKMLQVVSKRHHDVHGEIYTENVLKLTLNEAW